MKKIMFNDKYGLTKAVLENRKTQTRRIIHIDPAIRIDGCKTMPNGSVACAHLLENENIWMIDVNYKASYKVGEEVAIAQSYFNCGTKWAREHIDIASDLIKQSGYRNKMFVKAELMPHRIKITNIRIERLQDISEEDCLKEGVAQYETPTCHKHYCTRDCDDCAPSPREAFAILINKVSGKGTWDSNPWVFVYDFELIK